MKIRDLKKKDFVLYDYWGETYIININGRLTQYSYWEYDNGLYIQDGYEQEAGSWKEVKRVIKSLKENNKGFLNINSGKCQRCGVTLTEDNYKNEIDSNGPHCLIEDDYFYCNECKKKMYKEYADFMLDDSEEMEEE